MRLELVAPVYIGETVTAEMEVVEIDLRGRVSVRGRCVSDDGREVLRAQISGFPGRFAP
jgi:acyl dehydratase